MAKADEAEPVVPESELETDASADSSSSSDACEFPSVRGLSPVDMANYTPWAHTVAESGRIHLTEEAYGRVPICHIKTGAPLQGSVEDGVGLLNAPLATRTICSHCHSRLPEPVRKWLLTL